MRRCRTGSTYLAIATLAMNIAVLVASSQMAAASIYYVASYGSDDNSCDAAQDVNTPKRNIMGTAGGVACMQQPGDKLSIREGTYEESINNYSAPYPVPSGMDWDNAFTVANYAGENVVVRSIFVATNDDLNLNLSYWIFDGLRVINNIPGSGAALSMQWPHHLRFINMEVTTAGRANVPGTIDQCVQGGGTFIEFINVEVHDCGDPTVGPQLGAGDSAYGFYWAGDNSLFEHISLHDTTGYGFHIYNSGCDTGARNCPDRNIVRYSEIYNTGTLQNSAAILFAYGDGNQAHGNTIWNNSRGITVAYGASNSQVYNNLIDGNVYDGITNGTGWGGKPNSNTMIANNVVANNGGYGILNSAAGTPEGEPIATVIQDNVVSNNMYGNFLDTGIDTVTSNNVSSN